MGGCGGQAYAELIRGDMGLKRYTLLDIVGEMKAPFADPRSIQRSDVRDMALQAWELTPREQFNLLTMSYDKEVHTHTSTHARIPIRTRARVCVGACVGDALRHGDAPLGCRGAATVPPRLLRCGGRVGASAPSGDGPAWS